MTTTTDTPTRREYAGGPTVKAPERYERTKGFMSHIAFFLERNRGRAVMVLAVLTILVVLSGARGVLSGGIDLIGLLPYAALQMAFLAMAIIFQFGIMFWFLSRPRKYTVTPDDRPDRMSVRELPRPAGPPGARQEHGPHPPGRQGVRASAAARCRRACCCRGRPGTGKTFLAACIAAEANLPFIYIDASSLRGMFWGMTALMVMKLFRDARGLARKYAEKGKRGACIIFMDELDSIGLTRGGQTGHGHGHRRDDGRRQHRA